MITASSSSTTTHARRFGRIASVTAALTLMLGACTLPEGDGSLPTKNGARVYVIDDSRFVVAQGFDYSLAAYWCGASDFARRALGLDWRDRIYVSRSIDTKGPFNIPDTVEFSINPVALEKPLPQIRRTFAYQVGESKTVTSAQNLCDREWPRFDTF